jgi:hypothetical protein
MGALGVDRCPSEAEVTASPDAVRDLLGQRRHHIRLEYMPAEMEPHPETSASSWGPPRGAAALRVSLRRARVERGRGTKLVGEVASPRCSLPHTFYPGWHAGWTASCRCAATGRLGLVGLLQEPASTAWSPVGGTAHCATRGGPPWRWGFRTVWHCGRHAAPDYRLRAGLALGAVALGAAWLAVPRPGVSAAAGTPTDGPWLPTLPGALPTRRAGGVRFGDCAWWLAYRGDAAALA